MKHAILLLGAALIYLGTQAPAGAQQTAIKRSAAAPATLGPGDEVSIEVVELPGQFSAKAYRIDVDGSISLPLIGRVQAGGLDARTIRNSAPRETSFAGPGPARGHVTWSRPAVNRFR